LTLFKAETEHSTDGVVVGMVKNNVGNFVTFGNAILGYQVRFLNRPEIMLFKNYCDEYVSGSSVCRNTICITSI
jgi:hypothetical protein